MKFIKYGKYVGEPADAVDLEELIKRLGDFFLQSGFESQFYGMNEMDPEKSMEALRQAILRALQEGDLLPEGAMSEELREMLQSGDAMNNEAVRELIDKITERMANEGFINPQQPPQVTPPPRTSALHNTNGIAVAAMIVTPCRAPQGRSGRTSRSRSRWAAIVTARVEPTNRPPINANVA